ncbi:MAG TPA: hypothetical protein VEK57_10270 [Thermoanaerobaculia bacterium]|nr:hypothetical protein [Thermoanaerobaculia bacterium]
MARSQRLLLTLLLSLSAAAQPLSFPTEEPVSVARKGLAGGGTTAGDVHVASNGESFLAVWGDDRQVIRAHQGNFRSLGQAMRFAADGTPLDEESIALPEHPSGVVWGGTDWVVVTANGLTRIGADGRIIVTRSFRGVVEGIAEPAGIAWTGEAFVVPLYLYDRGLRTITFDRELNVRHVETLTTGPTSWPKILGDGQSALLAFYPTPAAGNGRVEAASFGRDGLLQGRKTVETLDERVTSLAAIGTSGEAYTLVVSKQVNNDTLQQAVRIQRDLTTRQIHTYTLPGALLSYDPTRSAREMAWDGTHLTLYTIVTWPPSYRAELTATKYTADGRIAEVLKPVSDWDPAYRLATAAGSSSGANLLAYAKLFYEPGAASAKVRLLRAGGTGSPDVALERGAFAQETPAAASSATQSLVAWRERTSPDGGFTVYATRLDANGEVLDPQSLELGTSACHEFGPAAASDGRDFIAVWFGDHDVSSAVIRADGTMTKQRVSHNMTGACGTGSLALVSNGTEYLAVWQKKVPERLLTSEVYGIRLRADGTPIDDSPFLILRDETEAHRSRLHVASNGHDYLVAWLDQAVRVSADGFVLEADRPIQLFGSVVGVWWNGRTYLALIPDWQGWRVLRFGSDGTTAIPPLQVEPTPYPPLLGSGPMAFATVCDAGGCSMPLATEEGEGRFTVSILRLEDAGTTFTARVQKVVNSMVPAYGDVAPIEAGAVRVPGGPLVVIRQLQRMEKPYSGVHRIFVSAVGPARVRTVRK